MHQEYHAQPEHQLKWSGLHHRGSSLAGSALKISVQMRPAKMPPANGAVKKTHQCSPQKRVTTAIPMYRAGLMHMLLTGSTAKISSDTASPTARGPSRPHLLCTTHLSHGRNTGPALSASYTSTKVDILECLHLDDSYQENKFLCSCSC